MLHKFIFKMGYFLKHLDVIHFYNEYLKTQWQSFEWLISQQEKQLRNLINFAYENVPYYTKLFRQIGIKPSDIVTIKDLEKLPILTKQIIRQNWQDFIPKNIIKLEYLNNSTGGSTGEPFKYRISKEDYERGVALLYRGWGYAGYKLGDKVAILAGSSLVPTPKIKLKKRIQEFFLNFRHYSSFEMSEENLFRYFYDINKWRPDFIRGYASSIYLFAKFMRDANLKLEFVPKGIFTTAEKLFEKQRKLIEQVFGARVFDNYGLNDGGVSAYECEEHNGMHIDTERAILEVTDDNGKQIFDQKGKILATSLYNLALPFIRYDTGDLGIISSTNCSCGRKSLLLKEISGRIQEFILTPNKLKIHGEFFTHIFWEIDNVSQFQVIQDKIDEIIIKIVPYKWSKMNEIDVEKIKKIISHKSSQLKITIEFVQENQLQYTKGGKYKFIINNLKEQDYYENDN